MTSPRLIQLIAFLEESPEDAFILFAIAKEYEKLEQLEKALVYYQKLIALDPDYVGAYYHLAKLYDTLENFELAQTTYPQGIGVAKNVGDQHALSELMNAKMNLELEM